MCHMYQISIANSSYILPAPRKKLSCCPPDRSSAFRVEGTRKASNGERSDDARRAAEIRGPMQPGYETVLTPAALEFVTDLTRRFGDRVAELLAARATVQKRLDDGALPDFLAETAEVRKAQWRVTRIPGRPAGSARRDHRPDRSQDGHQRAELGRESLHGGLRRLAHADLGQRRAGPDQPARCSRRARSRSRIPTASSTASTRRSRRCSCARAAGISTRSTCCVDGKPVPGAFVDFGLYLFHNHAALKARGTGPYFYLPKLENHREARLWADVLKHSEAEARHRAADDQGHGADRNHSRRVRDGRDPARAARTTSSA